MSAEETRSHALVLMSEQGGNDVMALEQSATLPGGWEEQADEEGNQYFVNALTGQSQWERPAAGAGLDLALVAEELWEELVDDHGTPYFFNEATGESCWELPALLPADATTRQLKDGPEEEVEGTEQQEGTRADAQPILERADDDGVPADEDITVDDSVLRGGGPPPDPEVDAGATDDAAQVELLDKAQQRQEWEDEVQALCASMAMHVTDHVIDVGVQRVLVRLKEAWRENLSMSQSSLKHAAHADYRQNKQTKAVEMRPGQPGYAEWLEAKQEKEEAEARAAASLVGDLAGVTSVIVDLGGSVVEPPPARGLLGTGGGWDEASSLPGSPTAPRMIPCDPEVDRSGFVRSRTPPRPLAVLDPTAPPAAANSQKLLETIRRLAEAEDAGQAPLRRVELNNERIGDDGADALASVLSASAVQQLFLVNNGIADFGAVQIAHNLKDSRSITELYLNDNDIGDLGLQTLTEVFADSALKVLNLSANPIGPRGAQLLGEMLVKPRCQLEVLLLAGQHDPKTAFKGGGADPEAAVKKMFRIGNSGAACVAAGLMGPYPSTLRKLWLLNSDIREEGCRALCAALLANSELTELNLGGNRGFQKEVSTLARALLVNTSLKTLLLDNCGLHAKNVSRLKRAHASTPDFGWKERRREALFASQLREWALGIAMERGFVFPRPPKTKSRKRRLPPSRLTKLDGEPTFEPAWKRGGLVDSWALEDLQQLVQEPVPSGEPIDVLQKLQAEVTSSAQSNTHMLEILKRDLEKTMEQLLVDEGELAQLKDAWRRRAQSLNAALVNIQNGARRLADVEHECEAQLARAHQVQSQSRSAAAAAKRVFQDLHASVMADHPSLAACVELSALLNQLHAVAPAREELVKDAARRRAVAEDALALAEAHAQEAEDRARAARQQRQAADQERLASFSEVQREASEYETHLRAVARRCKRLRCDKGNLEQGLGPLQELQKPLAEWLAQLGAAVQAGLARKEWTDCLPFSCGEDEVDDNVRRAVLRTRLLTALDAEARSRLVEARDAADSAAPPQAHERNAMAQEDVAVSAARLAQAVEAEAQARHEHEVVRDHPPSTEDTRSKGGNTRAADQALARARQPTAHRLKSAFLVNYGLDARVAQVEEERQEIARRELLAAQRRACSKGAPAAFAFSSTQLELSPRGKLEYLHAALRQGKAASPGPEGNATRKLIRELTRQRDMYKEALRKRNRRRGAMEKKLRRKYCTTPLKTIMEELQAQGVAASDMTEHHHMVDKLISAHVDAAYPELDREAFLLPKIKVVKRKEKPPPFAVIGPANEDALPPIPTPSNAGLATDVD